MYMYKDLISKMYSCNIHYIFVIFLSSDNVYILNIKINITIYSTIKEYWVKFLKSTLTFLLSFASR